MLRVTNFRVPVIEDTPLDKLVARRLKLPPESLSSVIIARRAVDARRKANIGFVYTLDVEVKIAEGQVLSRLSGDKDVSLVQPVPTEPIAIGNEQLEFQPVIVGLGPAGLMAALILAEYGYRPLVLERGRDVEKRSLDVKRFWETGQFDPISNVQFGEGGAGTFSDGKLTTRVNDPRMGMVIDKFVAAGAPAEIKYMHKPHVGTDKLRAMVKNLRQMIIAAGGQVEFEAQVTDVEITDGQLTAVTINDSRRIPCNIALLGVGHSARDTYQMLYERGLALEAKIFSVGVRIEHPQELIDRAQYGGLAGHPKLGAADYALVYHDKLINRSVYSFCMCPGGLVVAASSEAGGVVVNGMSNFDRASGIANSALVVNVTPADFDGPLGGIEFQRHYEQLAFQAGGGNYYAPAQTVGDYLAGKKGKRKGLLGASYRPDVEAAELHRCLPDFVTAPLARALPQFGQRIKGFDNPSAIMTGVETRTSAPVRLLRGNDYVSLNVGGLYPIGEGAGYAGGIMSAALDGLNAALMIIKKYRPF